MEARAAQAQSFAAAGAAGIDTGSNSFIDAKSERVAAWYSSYDAVSLADKPPTLVMALATVEAHLKARGHL